MVSYPLVADYIHLQNPTSCLHKSTNMHLLRHRMKAIKMWKIAFFFKKKWVKFGGSFFWRDWFYVTEVRRLVSLFLFVSRTHGIELSALILVGIILQGALCWSFRCSRSGGLSYMCVNIGFLCLFKCISPACNCGWGTSAWGEDQMRSRGKAV